MTDAAPVTITQIDAFTDRPFAGNPAGVLLLDRPAEPAWMQSLAAEMNLSETAFLVPVDGGWNLRWFTPTVEVDLCGHATLASAYHLFTDHGVAEDELRFDTRSGWLTATRRADGWIELDFPADITTATPIAEAPDGLWSGLGLGEGVGGGPLARAHRRVGRGARRRGRARPDPGLPPPAPGAGPGRLRDRRR